MRMTPDKKAPQRKRGATSFALVFALVCASVGAAGCRVDMDDVHRWENTTHGPEKLVAVVLHDKYELPLRVEAALSLVRMKPRQGRRVGIGMMVDALASVTETSPETGKAISASLVPELMAELKKPPPPAQAGQPAPPDGSFPFKDAAHALLTFERMDLIGDAELVKALKTTLTEWAMADFEHRLENRSQAYGMEQLLRVIGASGVAGLPKLMVRDARRLDQMASLVAELGDEPTKQAASGALVEIAKYVASSEWLKIKKPEVQAANTASKLSPTEKQLEAQLGQYQEEELFRVFSAMKKVGGRPTVQYLLGFAANKEAAEKKRQAALAALEGKIDKNSAADLDQLLAVVSGDAPDVVLDQVFRRIGELPREQVSDKLFGLFKTDKWKVRRAAAATLLRMSKVSHIDEFMSKLPSKGGKGFAMSEALSYGALFGDLKEGKPKEALQKHMKEGSAAVRTSALSYYFTYGTPADLADLKAFEDERNDAPVCESDPECKWSCEVAKESDPKQRELKDIKTIGEFVRYCIEPAVKERQPEPKAPGAKQEGTKDTPAKDPKEAGAQPGPAPEPEKKP